MKKRDGKAASPGEKEREKLKSSAVSALTSRPLPMRLMHLVEMNFLRCNSFFT